MIFFLGGQTLLNESSVSTHIRREDESKNWMMAVFFGRNSIVGATWIATSFQATLSQKKILAANIWARGTKTAIGTYFYCYHSWKIPRLFKHKKGASPLKLARFKYKIKGGEIENQTLKWNSSILFEK